VFNKINFKDINILDIGNEIQLVGAVYSGKNKNYLCIFPSENIENLETVMLKMSLSEWEEFLRQSDLLETEILRRGPQGITKAIVRKTQRQIDANVTWQVFKRDDYACRYCGKNHVPLTIDHLILWENGGPTIMKNLVAACKPCNRKRGRIAYSDWLASDYYKEVSKNLSEDVKTKNIELIEEIKHINKVQHIRNR